MATTLAGIGVNMMKMDRIMNRTNGSLFVLLLSVAALATCGGSSGGGTSDAGGRGGGGNGDGGPGTSGAAADGGAGSTGYALTYDGNGATGGSVPVDSNAYASGQSVTVLGNTGNLGYAGYTFVGWQTKADGSGTTYAPGTTFAMGAGSTTLYALWAGGYAYAVNQNQGSAGSVSQYTIGPNGALTPMLAPTVVTNGSNSQQVAVDPVGHHAYVTNVSSNTISQFTIGSDGALTPLSTPISLGSGPGIYYPWSIAVHPSGNWVYVSVNQRSTVAQFTIGSDGTLSPMTPSTVAAGAYPDTVAIDPSGKFAYVSNGDANSVSQYTIDPTSGALSPSNPPAVATGRNAWFVTVEPKGRYAYVSSYDDGTVSQYAIDPTTGTLSPLTPPTVSTGGTMAAGIAVDPSGQYAYVTMSAAVATPSTVIAQFNIDQTNGTLSLMDPPAVSAGGVAADFIAVDASGKYAYATSGDTGWGSTSVAQYTIGANGALTLMTNATVLSGYGPTGIVTLEK